MEAVTSSHASVGPFVHPGKRQSKVKTRWFTVWYSCMNLQHVVHYNGFVRSATHPQGESTTLSAAHQVSGILLDIACMHVLATSSTVSVVVDRLRRSEVQSPSHCLTADARRPLRLFSPQRLTIHVVPVCGDPRCVRGFEIMLFTLNDNLTTSHLPW